MENPKKNYGLQKKFASLVFVDYTLTRAVIYPMKLTFILAGLVSVVNPELPLAVFSTKRRKEGG